jgi:ethanolaminephosphotransferase
MLSAIAGMMTYGNGYFGVLEANYGLAVVPFISGIFGPQVWKLPLAYFADVPPKIAKFTLVDVAFTLALICMLIQIAGQLWRVFRFTGPMDPQEKGHKELGALKALEHLLYMAVVFCLSFLFLTQPKADHPYFDRALLLCVTIAYTMLATQLIIAHMAKEKFTPKIRLYLLGMTAGVVNAVVDLINPVPLVFFFAVAFVLFYLHYVVNVCNQVCEYLGIKCLTIPNQKPE